MVMSRRRLVSACAAVILAPLPAIPAMADDAAWAALKTGGSVALVRHAATPGGAGDPPGFRLEDCATQRNLTEKGRAQARELGERFRAAGISVGKVVSSQWCRCRETAELMDLGPVEISATFNNAFAFRERAGELATGAREVIAGWSGPGTLVIVTHGANILPLTSIHPPEGGAVVVNPESARQDRLRVLGQISPGS